MCAYRSFGGVAYILAGVVVFVVVVAVVVVVVFLGSVLYQPLKCAPEGVPN